MKMGFGVKFLKGGPKLSGVNLDVFEVVISEF